MEYRIVALQRKHRAVRVAVMQMQVMLCFCQRQIGFVSVGTFAVQQKVIL